jgi:aspartyl-tRNA(Asn)/glutamyl-tRNA(Gln) amidotransferase subunit A
MRGDPLGPLHGVPVSVKDLIDVAGLPARYGSLTMKDNIARADAPSVERLRRAGAIILGKTATPEFGYQGQTTSLVHGVTRNPWNTALTPGGSSGGAVASVAAGVTSIALGTDGGGSLRNPAALTGLVAIKANFGRVPVWPASVNPLLLHVGPIARNVADAVLMLSVIAAPDRRATPAVSAIFRQARIAVPPRARQTIPPKPPQPKAHRRRGRPRRSATPS